MKKRVNKCPSWGGSWGCAISTMKTCVCCPNADWHYEESTSKREEEEITRVAQEHCNSCVALKFPTGDSKLKETDIIAAVRYGIEWADEHIDVESALKTLWNDSKNKVLKFFESKGLGVYDETILEDSIKDEKKELIDKACEWMEHHLLDNVGKSWKEVSDIFRKAMEGE